MNIIYATIGASGSGKSTWAVNYAIGNQLPFFSSDDIRAELGNINDQSQNKKVFQTLYSRLASALQKTSVIMDATNYSEQSRLPLIQIAKDVGAGIEWKYFNASLNQCFENNKKRERVVPENVIRRQWTSLTLPFDGVEFMNIPAESTITQCVIVDLDGTLAHNISGRSPFDGTRVFEDAVNWPVWDLVNRYWEDESIEVIFLSGREGTDICAAETIRFLEEKCDFANPLLFMRSEKDHRKDWLIKWEIYETKVKPFYEVIFALDDRDQVVNMWRNGPKINCFQVAEGNF